MRRTVAIAVSWLLAGPAAGLAAGPSGLALGSAARRATARASAAQASIAFGRPNLVSLTNVPVRIAGELSVGFHGDQATGCAAHGLCGYSGTVVWQPPPTGMLSIAGIRQHGRIMHQVSLELFGLSRTSPGIPEGGVATAHVHGPSATPGAPLCTDAVRSNGGLELPVRRHAVVFTVAGFGDELTATRCAGPLDGDYGSALRSPAMSLASVRRGHATIGLEASHGFAAHGFAGTVSSNLVLRLGRPMRVPVGGNSSRSGHVARLRYVAIHYGVRIAGSVRARVIGDPRSCDLLASCGVTDAIELRPRPVHGDGYIYAFAPARRPDRDLLAAIGIGRNGNRRGVRVIGVVTWDRGGALRADFVQRATPCRDSTSLGAGLIELGFNARSLSARYAGPDLHTRCPGPLVSGDQLAAGGPLRVLSHRTVTFKLTEGAALLDDGYTGRTVADLTVTLTRRRVSTGLMAG